MSIIMSDYKNKPSIASWSIRFNLIGFKYFRLAKQLPTIDILHRIHRQHIETKNITLTQI